MFTINPTNASFKPKTPVNAKLLSRCYALLFGDDPDIAMSRVVRLRGTDGKLYSSPLHKKFFSSEDRDRIEKDQLSYSDEIVCSVPDDSSQGYFDIQATVYKVDDPPGWSKLENLVVRRPRELNEIHISFDIRASMRTAMDLNASVTRWPSIQIPAVDDPTIKALSALANIVDVSLPEIKEPSKERMDKYVDAMRDAVASCLEVGAEFPAGCHVSAVASKSVNEWRTWIESLPYNLEGARLRTQIHSYLLDSLAPLFRDLKPSHVLALYREESL